MAIISGGDITEISWSNPDLGSGFFFPVAGEDSTYDLGGIRANDDGILDGAGRLINSMNRKPWMFSVLVANDMVNNNEFEAASAIAQSTVDTTWAFTNINGVTYQAQGTIQGTVELNGNKSTFTLKVVGGGNLVKQ